MTATELLQEIIDAETNVENKNRLYQLQTLVDGLVHDAETAKGYHDRAIEENTRLLEQVDSLQARVDAFHVDNQSDVSG